MNAFPDESKMERSADGTEPIRGGSIGLNRILGRFVAGAGIHHNPEFTAVLISAYTVLRNVLGTLKDPTPEEMEQAFVKDINLFLEYYDTYLSITKNAFLRDRRAVVMVYFPDYRKIDKKILREYTGKKQDPFDVYHKFLSRYNGRDEMVRELEHVTCFWINAENNIYPHKDVARKFKDIASGPKSAYSNGDRIALISHIPLDFYLAARLRNVCLLESYTGKIKEQKEFKLRLNKEGHVPFTPVAHLALGDGTLIKPMATLKQKKAILEQAEKERWHNLRDEEVSKRILHILELKPSDVRKYDFV